jgi:formylmethanofuran dehydrogenase subunit C
MAIGTPTAIGQNATSSSATSLVITTTAAVPAGAMIFLEIANHNSAAVVPSSVTDSAGNSYTLVSAANSSSVSETLAYALNASALASGQTITITFPSSRNAAAAAYSVTGIATASAADQQATNTTGSGASPSVGPTGTTTQADELVIGLFGYGNSRTFTPGSGYTALATIESTGTVRGTTGEYKIVSATGAQTADGTFNSSATYAGVIVTFKGAAATGVALSASGTVALTGAAALSCPALTASGTLAITGAAALVFRLSASGTVALTGAAVLSASFPATAGTLALTGAAALSVTGGIAALAASGTLAITGAAALVFPLAAAGTIRITGAAALSCPALSSAGSIALTGAAVLSASFPVTAGTLALTGAAALSVSGGLTALAASGTIRVTGSPTLTAGGGPVALTASGTLRITGAAAITPVAPGAWFSTIGGGGQWHWTRFRRPLIDRYLNISIAASGGTGYLSVTADGVNFTWYSGPLGVDGRTLTQVADETAAKAAAIALPVAGVWALPATTEARAFKLYHKASLGAYQIYEFYPRRLVEADDIRAESIKAIHIAAGSITGDRLSAVAIDGFVITGATIQTAATGARVVLSSAAAGGFIGYGPSDTYNPATGVGTYQARWSKADGKIYAGGGVVVLDTTGIGVTAASGGAAVDLNSYRFLIGSAVVGKAYGYYDASTTSYVGLRSDAPATRNAVLELVANGPTGKNGQIMLQALGNNFGNEVDLSLDANTNVITMIAARVDIQGATGSQLAITDASRAYNGGNGALRIILRTNTNKKLYMGWDDTLDTNGVGYIQAVETGTNWRSLLLNPAGGNVGIGTLAPTEKLAVSGNINVSGVYKVAGTQVLDTRRTGWGTPTGTLYRTALTNASTQTQFNQAIMAIITDLIAHGLFGT